jgi:voltage-gated potassium channel
VIHGFRRVQHELAVVGFVAVVVLLTSSLAVYELEHDVQPQQFRHLWDALWWSFVTLTTVGYGDLVPVTIGGRLIGIVTMLVGIGIFGTFISLVGSSFLTTMREQQQAAASGRIEGEPVEESPPWTAPRTVDLPPGDFPG